MESKIRIKQTNKKWTTFKYVNSSARSRMSTDKLMKKIEEGRFLVVNSVSPIKIQ